MVAYRYADFAKDTGGAIIIPLQIKDGDCIIITQEEWTEIARNHLLDFLNKCSWQAKRVSKGRFFSFFTYSETVTEKGTVCTTYCSRIIFT